MENLATEEPIENTHNNLFGAFASCKTQSNWYTPCGVKTAIGTDFVNAVFLM
jgi:hypothetical protein